ncbi:MAG: hypothetical protein QOI98_624, partial [Solirubrobacteraceae bacterium]|nr:hypothetical protein [Solirubrobacteraceae bacterium]
EGQEILAALDSERAHATAHALTADGRLLSGGAAVPEVAAALRGGALPAYLSRAAPGLTARAYDWVAGHRETFGKALTAGQRRRAAARLADRRASGTEESRAL